MREEHKFHVHQCCGKCRNNCMCEACTREGHPKSPWGDMLGFRNADVSSSEGSDQSQLSNYDTDHSTPSKGDNSQREVDQVEVESVITNDSPMPDSSYGYSHGSLGSIPEGVTGLSHGLENMSHHEPVTRTPDLKRKSLFALNPNVTQTPPPKSRKK